MPISKHNKQRYPRNWAAISKRIKDRARWRCEGCARYPHCRAVHGQPHPVTGSTVVLTVAHIDHNPANCADTNLVSQCQRCHLARDAELHAQNRAKTRFQKASQGWQTRFDPSFFRDEILPADDDAS